MKNNLIRQNGSYTVEFAFSVGIFLFLVFAAIETGRMLYTWSALNFVTQRGARVAAVCPLNDASIAQIAVYGSGNGSTSTIIPGVDTSNISVTYMDESGSVSNAYAEIAYVTVSIADYTHELLIPTFMNENMARQVLAPAFSTTLPVESLGYNPSSESRECFV